VLAIGLTGGIASGKSVIRHRLEERGVATLDADCVVHDLFASKNAVTESLKARFGPDIVNEDKTKKPEKTSKLSSTQPSKKRSKRS